MTIFMARDTPRRSPDMTIPDTCDVWLGEENTLLAGETLTNSQLWDLTEPRNARILVVDDDQTNIEVVTDLLHSIGVRSVFGLTHPTKIMQHIAQHAADVVLLDVRMPGQNGLDVLAQLKADQTYGTIPVIMITALIDRSTRYRALSLGAHHVLTKPVDRS